MTGAVRMSPAVTGKPAPASVLAIEARVREVVLVTRASGTPAARSRCRAATAPGSGFHETVTAPAQDTGSCQRPGLKPTAGQPAINAPRSRIPRHPARPDSASDPEERPG